MTNTYLNFMSSREFGQETFGPYTSEEEARDGFFRLVVSASVSKDGVSRYMYASYGDQEHVTAVDQQTTQWTEEYKQLIFMDDAFCRQERINWDHWLIRHAKR